MEGHSTALEHMEGSCDLHGVEREGASLCTYDAGKTEMVVNDAKSDFDRAELEQAAEGEDQLEWQVGNSSDVSEPGWAVCAQASRSVRVPGWEIPG